MGGKLTPLATTMLAMLGERPMHCYEMYRLMMARREDRIVKINPGSLYHTVDRLAALGFVEATGTERAGGRPERTTYAVTPAGREALRHWVRDVLTAPVEEFPQLPVALARCHTLPRAEISALLRKRIEYTAAGVETDERILEEAAGRGTDPVYLLDAHYQLAMQRAELSWLRGLARRMEDEELTWPTT